MKSSIPSYDREIAECDQIFLHITKTIERQKGYTVDLPLLAKAYQTAKQYHGDTRRHSGVLYLRHPLAVMESLSRLMCKTSVLAAALLHDTMEDCDLPYETIRKDFSYEIAEIVQAVTKIKAEEAGKGSRLDTMTADERHTFLDRLTDAKLISSQYQREAFLVRFADRAHNLSTIDACAPGKRIEKIASTREFLIPAAEKLGMRYFSIILNNNCMKFEGEDFHSNESAYIRRWRNQLICQSSGNYSRFDQILQDAVNADDSAFSFPRFNPLVQLRGDRKEDKKEDRNWVKAAHRRVLHAYEIKQQMHDFHDLERSRLDLWEIILTCRDTSQQEMVAHFLALYRAHLRDAGLFLTYVCHDATSVVMRLTDQYENNYRIVLVLDFQLEEYFIGNPRGERLTMINEEAPGDALRQQITVFSYSPRKGYREYTRRVPFGATALDFAFIIKPELAYTVKSAWIHNWKEGTVRSG